MKDCDVKKELAFLLANGWELVDPNQNIVAYTEGDLHVVTDEICKAARYYRIKLAIRTKMSIDKKGKAIKIKT